jgi:hypothetical protein
MGDVGQGIFELALGQRAMAPVGEAGRLVDLDMRDLACQRFIRRGIAEAAHHGGDLGVEQRVGQHAALQVEDLDILPRRMQHFHNVRPRDQLVERLEVQPRRQRINDAFHPRRRDLDQAQLGVIGLVAQEFGIQRQVGSARQLGQERCKVFVILDYPHGAGDSRIRRFRGAFLPYGGVSPTARPAKPAASK